MPSNLARSKGECPFEIEAEASPMPSSGVIAVLSVYKALFAARSLPPIQVAKWPPFYHRVAEVKGICIGANNRTASHAGHIGLEGDSEDSPKRSFFWYFEAENDAQNAPIILTMGGGPGTSGLMNPLFGQSPCRAGPSGLAPNPHRWTEHHNLIALDHPIGVGFSYGSRVNNSRAAAHDVYDFLQKFFILFPHLASNKFVISGGSYGGVYVPTISTPGGHGRPGSVHINLEALILSNPGTDPMSHFRWLLQYRCDHEVYNSTTCTTLYSELPMCLESIDMAFEIPTVENRVRAWELCSHLGAGDTHGTVIEDIRRTCHPDSDAPDACHPQFGWFMNIFRDPDVRAALGVPDHLNYSAINIEVNAEFHAAGDFVQKHHLLYPPLLEAGIRVLHYIGAQDANCAWPGVLSFLKLLETPFQKDFLSAPDVPWPSTEVATVRSEAGHFTVNDQPALAKIIVERWVANVPFLEKQ
ncbi:alpha/beta-hydrolase [Mycena sp. CBHHK59/15]|nr:alpha/beta-hydrolase [Mycena sp. CBHHK59/15]